MANPHSEFESRYERSAWFGMIVGAILAIAGAAWTLAVFTGTTDLQLEVDPGLRSFKMLLLNASPGIVVLIAGVFVMLIFRIRGRKSTKRKPAVVREFRGLARETLKPSPSGRSPHAEVVCTTCHKSLGWAEFDELREFDAVIMGVRTCCGKCGTVNAEVSRIRGLRIMHHAIASELDPIDWAKGNLSRDQIRKLQTRAAIRPHDYRHVAMYEEDETEMRGGLGTDLSGIFSLSDLFKKKDR